MRRESTTKHDFFCIYRSSSETYILPSLFPNPHHAYGKAGHVSCFMSLTDRTDDRFVLAMSCQFEGIYRIEAGTTKGLDFGGIPIFDF